MRVQFWGLKMPSLNGHSCSASVWEANVFKIKQVKNKRLRNIELSSLKQVASWTVGGVSGSYYKIDTPVIWGKLGWEDSFKQLLPTAVQNTVKKLAGLLHGFMQRTVVILLWKKWKKRKQNETKESFLNSWRDWNDFFWVLSSWYMRQINQQWNNLPLLT